MYSAGFSSSSWRSPIFSLKSDRAAAAVLAAAVLLLATPQPAKAADPPVRTTSAADSAARAARPKTPPYKVMLRSAAVPGWGQLYNHQPLKAALVVGVEGVLVVSALRELKLQNDALQRAVDAGANGDTAAQELAIMEADTHRNRKITWIWWEVAAHLLSMADAYVDANLSTFAADFGREEGGLPDQDPVVVVSLRVRF